MAFDMSLPTDLQIKELLDKSSSVLIIVPKDATGDAFGAAAGLGAFLEQAEKNITIAGDGIRDVADSFSFLNPPASIVSSVSGVREFILSFNTKHNNIVSVRTERQSEEYNIYITPEKGSIDPRDFSFVPAKFSFDLVFVIGATDKDSLGKIYEENPDIFYEVPIIAIDHHAENDRFGQINIVDITASTTSEVVTLLLEKIGTPKIDSRSASLLLGGIVTGTDSFQKKTTTPGALHAASRLMDHGADQHDIIFRLVKTQPFPILKFWGRVMSNLKWDESRKLMWAKILPEDMSHFGVTTKDLPFVLEKIRSHSSIGSIFLLIFPENPSSIRVFARCRNGNEEVSLLSKAFPKASLRGEVMEWSTHAVSLDKIDQEILQRIPVV